MSAAKTIAVSAEVLTERLRQLDSEGWDAQHDDEHDDGELARAAAAYAIEGVTWSHVPLSFWPWDGWLFKPRSRRENLIRAAALILAEIERLDRAATKATR